MGLEPAAPVPGSRLPRSGCYADKHRTVHPPYLKTSPRSNVFQSYKVGCGMDRGWRGVGLLIVVVVGLAVPISILGRPAQGPYQLNVGFRQGTSIPTAQAVIRLCAKSPAVVNVGPLRTPGRFRVELHTEQTSGRQVNALLKCLRNSPSVGGASWPG
jgi:hypothetical protein